MPTESATERRALKAAQLGATPPVEQEHLPCPRCDSINTKFCYYNNYNYSQPRHFCKSCRRYWTQGGTLRDIPVGGGTRRNSSKRSRILPSAAALTSSTLATTTTAEGLVSGITTTSCNSPSFTGNRDAVGCSSVMEAIPAGGPIFVSLPGTVGPYMNMSDVQFSKLGGCGPTGGSFTSLLSGSGNGAGLLAFGGFGLGLGPGFEDTGLLARGVWPFQEVGYLSGGGGGGASGGGIGGGMNGGSGGGLGGNSWQLESGDGGFVGGDSISWPELAISTPGNGV